MTTYAHILNTPAGELLAAVNEGGALLCLDFIRHGDHERDLDKLTARLPKPITWSAEPCRHVEQQLAEYFAGQRRDFDLAVEPQGTEFQRQVWHQLLEIPYGTTCSYQDIAQAIGRPQAVRAVGRANGTNPIPIVIPCHRVIGANGTLTGYGGGLDVKRQLLVLEGVLLV